MPSLNLPSLNLIVPTMFDSAEALRAFVASDDYSDLAYLVQVAVEPHTDEEVAAEVNAARDVLFSLTEDLQTLAQAAAAGVPLHDDGGGDDEVIGDLHRLARLCAHLDFGDDAVPVLMRILEHVARRAGAKPTAQGRAGAAIEGGGEA